MKKLLIGLLALVPMLTMGQISGGGGRGGGGGVNPTGSGAALTGVGVNPGTYYLRIGGNDGTAKSNDVNYPWVSPWLCAAAANAAAVAGQTNVIIDLGLGTFPCGTNKFNITNGVSIQGKGKYNSWITFGYTNSSDMCLSMSPATSVQHCGIVQTITNLVGTTIFPIGVNQNGFNGSLGKALISDCWIQGQDDGVYFDCTDTQGTSSNELDVEYCSGGSHWDMGMVIGTNSALYFRWCEVTTTGPTNGTVSAAIRGLVCNSGYLYVDGCLIHSSFTNGVCTGVKALTGNSHVMVDNTTFDVNCTNNTINANNGDITIANASASVSIGVGNKRLDKGLLQVGHTVTGTPTYIGNVDPSMIHDYLSGPPMSSPSRAWNFGGTVTSTNQTFLGQEFANTNIATNLSIAQHFGGRGTAPTIVTNAGAGSSTATVTLDANASDAAMTITLATGTLPTGSATVFTCTYNTAYATKPHVMAYPGNNNAAALNGVTMVFDDSANDTASAFTFKSGGTGLTASTTYIWNVHIVQ